MTMRQMVLALADAPPPTFASFVPGRNGAALAALEALGTPRSEERCIYLWGAPGSGRSHLLAAWQAARAGEPRCQVVDDVDSLDETAQIALFSLYNRARAGAAWLLVAGSAAPGALALRDDLKSRLAWGLAFEILPLTDEEKRGALAARAAARGIRLSAEMLDYLLARTRRDMSSLMAQIDALDRYSLEHKRAITLPLLREILNQNQSLLP
ncbi:MAG: DnaA regulatory inactivator Hda [Burkholderiales bacterium]|nr:DnaA regulatory inactivator Hda [Burkholderiales bacterium]